MEQIKPMYHLIGWKEKNQGHLCDLLPKLHNFNLIIRKYNNPNWRTFYQITSLQYSKMSLLWKIKERPKNFWILKMFKGSWQLWSCMTTYAWFWNGLFSYKGLYRDNWENLNGNWGGTNVWISASWMAVL